MRPLLCSAPLLRIFCFFRNLIARMRSLLGSAGLCCSFFGGKFNHCGGRPLLRYFCGEND